MQTTSEVEARFLDWFRQSGGTLDDRCRIQPVEGMGRGMVALQPIKAGEVLFVIPRHVLLNLATSSLAERCQQAETEQASGTKTTSWSEMSGMGWVPLILAMMFERRRASITATPTNQGDVSMEDIDVSTKSKTQTWGPYLDIMPTQFDTPMFWSAEDLKHLKGTSIIDKIAREEAEADYHTKALPYIHALPTVFLDDVAPDQLEQEVARWYSLETYHVMGSRVLSRSFHVKTRTNSKDGKAVGMDIEDDDDDDDAEQEVLEDEGENNEQEEPTTIEEAGDTTSDIKDNDDSDDDDDDEEDEEEKTIDISMTPMADMLNAKFESDNARLFYKSQVLEMRATKDIAAGDQIFNTYADPPNSDLLRRYGHVDEPNGSDVVEMDANFIVKAAAQLLTSVAKVDAADVKTDLAERLEWACSSLGIDEVLILNYLFMPSAKLPHRPQPERPTARELKAAATGGGISEEMVALARIMCMSRDSFEKARVKGKGPSARIEAVEEHPTTKNGKAHRISVAQVLVDAIDLRLREYGDDASIKTSSLHEVEEARLYGSKRNEILNSHQRQAFVVRLGEKRVLQDQRRVLSYVLDRLAEASTATDNKRKSASTPTSQRPQPKKKGR